MCFSSPKPQAAAPAPAAATPVPGAENAPDPDALENAANRAKEAKKRNNRANMTIALGGGTGSGLSV